jgi:hypothetical protein
MPRFSQIIAVPLAAPDRASDASAGPRKVRRGRLYNATEAARKIGISRYSIQMMKRAGLRFDLGRMTSLETIFEWISAHPEFRPSLARLKKHE